MTPRSATAAWLLCVVAASGPGCASDRHTDVPDVVQQGALVIGRTAEGNHVSLGGRALRVGRDGRFVFGVGRDESGPLQLAVDWFDGATEKANIRVTGRDWPVEKVRGVPPATVNPPPDIAARIAREQAAVNAVRTRDDDRDDYEQAFHWPVQGRISGRFGNQRVYVLDDGTTVPKAPHSGMDIAAATGTLVRSPAAGVVTFVAPDLYLTGGTVVVDHGHGISSNFLHLSRIDVKVGDAVAQDQVLGAVGATGRASGPHLHWGMNWFDTRVDPLLVLAPGRSP